MSDKAKAAVAKKRRFLRRKSSPSRRIFLAQGLVSTLGGAIGLRAVLHGSNKAELRSTPGVPMSRGSAKVDHLPIRPPTASIVDADFQSACIRCGLCGIVCENGCIRFFGLNQGKWGVLTPYLDVRERSCTLCMRCTDVCPTSALQKVEPDLKIVTETINMGKAVVDPNRCVSYLGRLCGYCHDACPIPQIAIRLTSQARPVVLDGCIGCGRCVEQCPQTPTAIDVIRGALA